MGKLEDLYKVREMLHANGMEMSGEQKKALAEEEDKFIRTGLYGVLKQAAGETLSKLRSPVRIVIDYEPDKEIELVISRNDEITHVAKEASDEKVIDAKETPAELESQQDADGMNGFAIRNASVGFSVKFADGTVISA
jgi:hypothetical protein